jgi:hypothetical protein
MSRKVFGPIMSKDGWRIRNNKKAKFIKGEDIVKCVKVQKKINFGNVLKDWKI